jgi:hypothetical protein
VGGQPPQRRAARDGRSTRCGFVNAVELAGERLALVLEQHADALGFTETIARRLGISHARRQ